MGANDSLFEEKCSWPFAIKKEKALVRKLRLTEEKKNLNIKGEYRGYIRKLNNL